LIGEKNRGKRRNLSARFRVLYRVPSIYPRAATFTRVARERFHSVEKGNPSSKKLKPTTSFLVG
jgi:hypothetical protein